MTQDKQTKELLKAMATAISYLFISFIAEARVFMPPENIEALNEELNKLLSAITKFDEET